MLWSMAQSMITYCGLPLHSSKSKLFLFFSNSLNVYWTLSAPRRFRMFCFQGFQFPRVLKVYSTMLLYQLMKERQMVEITNVSCAVNNCQINYEGYQALTQT